MATLTTTTAPAWHGNPALKDEVVARLRAHRAADEIVKGLYQQYDPNLASGYRGCAIGCTLPPMREDSAGEPAEPDWHSEVERRYAVPAPIGYLIDRIFESLPTAEGQHAAFAVAVIEAIPVGADLSLVPSRVVLDVLGDPERGVWLRTTEGSAQRDAVMGVVALCQRRLTGDEPTAEEWRAMRAAAYAAYAAADTAADTAAYAAYAYAAYAAADTAAYAAVRSGHWGWVAGRLIHHLATAPIPVAA